MYKIWFYLVIWNCVWNDIGELIYFVNIIFFVEVFCKFIFEILGCFEVYDGIF